MTLAAGLRARALGWKLRVDSIWSEATDAVARYLGRMPWLSPEDRHYRTSRVGLYHRVVWAIPEDAIGDGWATVSGDGADLTAQIDKDLGVEWALLEARASARQDRGAWLWPVTSDKDWSTPLGPGPHEVKALHVLTADEVTVDDLERDPESKKWSRPLYVRIQAQRDDVYWNAPRVHTSRLIYMPGAPATANQQTPTKGYDLSVLELYRAAIDDYENGVANVGRLLSRLPMPWVKLKGAQAVAGGSDPDYEASLQLLRDGMEGGAGLMVLLGEDEVGWSGPTLTGLRDAVNVLAERVGLVEGVPLSRLLGQAPGGLSTDDASGNRAYNAVLARERRMILEPVLLELYDFVLGPDANRKISWPPLDKPTALEAAQISETNARRDAALIAALAIGPDESRARFEGGEERPLPKVEVAAPEPPKLGDPGPGPSVDPGAMPDGAVAPDVQKTALNGAQVASAMEIVAAVAARDLPRETGLAMLVSFFSLSPTEAGEIMGPVGLTFFVEKPEPPMPGQPPGASADPDAKPDEEKPATDGEPDPGEDDDPASVT